MFLVTWLYLIEKKCEILAILVVLIKQTIEQIKDEKF